jgi:hypothetical protein
VRLHHRNQPSSIGCPRTCVKALLDLMSRRSVLTDVAHIVDQSVEIDSLSPRAERWMAKTRGSDPENVDLTPGWMLTDKSPPIDGMKRSATWDMNQVGVRELSYGGFLTLIAATDQPTLHRAAVALPSIVHIPLPANDFGGYSGRARCAHQARGETAASECPSYMKMRALPGTIGGRMGGQG